MENKGIEPFWEKSYSDNNMSTFSEEPTKDIVEFYEKFKPNSLILDVGCGEGRNSIFLASKGHTLDAFDISHSGIKKSIMISSQKNVCVNFFQQDISDFNFTKTYDVVMSSGVLHLPEKETRNKFIKKAQDNTVSGGYNVISIFTDRLPATPDNAPFTKSLFKVGEILDMYRSWEILRHKEGTFTDKHPGDISHEHAYESVIAKKP